MFAHSPTVIPHMVSSTASSFGAAHRRQYIVFINWLRVVVEPADGPDAKQEYVNIRVPAALIRAGIRFSSFMSAAAADTVNERLREHGVDLDVRKIKLEDPDQIVDAMSELNVDVHNTREKVRIFFE